MRRAHFCGFVGALQHAKSREAMARGMKAAGMIPGTDTYKKMGYESGFKCAVYFSTSYWNNKNQMKVRRCDCVVFAPHATPPRDARRC